MIHNLHRSHVHLIPTSYNDTSWTSEATILGKLVNRRNNGAM